MKLCSWNVNGIRSVHQKGFGDWLKKENPDIFCLQEVKASPEQLPLELREIEGYSHTWSVATRRGYSGVALYTRIQPERTQIGLGIEAFDTEGRVVQAEFKDFVLINAYFPNSQRDHARLSYKLDFCNAMMKQLESIRAQGKNVVLCGDFNIAHQAIDLKNPKQNENNAGFLPQERAWFTELVNTGYIDTFRNFESQGDHYTWWSYRPTIRERNIGWRLDYFVCNPEFQSRLKGCSHQTKVLGSDHCPVALTLH